MKVFLYLYFSIFVPSKVFVRGSTDPPAASWDNCITDGVDYTGDNVIAGLRFSSEECAIWCSKIGKKSVKVFNKYLTKFLFRPKMCEMGLR